MNRLKKTGVARVLSKLGICSRKEAVSLILTGKVKIGSRIIRDPEFPLSEPYPPIRVEGRSVQKGAKVYFMMHKPKGVVTTRSDERGRKTVYNLLDEGLPNIFPVGRLDKESSGLLLLTNDTAWGNRITAPESKLPKTYHVKLTGIVPEDALERLRKGFSHDGVSYLPVSVEKIREREKSCWVEIVLREGKNRQIRKMFAGLGYEVENLVRIKIGKLPLGNLKPGETRSIAPSDV